MTKYTSIGCNVKILTFSSLSFSLAVWPQPKKD